MDIFTMVILLADRMAYMYRGNMSRTGFWMVRINNFLVFALTLGVMLVFNMYLKDLYANEGQVEKYPKRLDLSVYLGIFGIFVLCVSQFTGFYYTFDPLNYYHRTEWFPLCYLFPAVIAILQMSVIFEYRNKLSSKLYMSIVLFSMVPVIASLFQLFLSPLIELSNIVVHPQAAL